MADTTPSAPSLPYTLIGKAIPTTWYSDELETTLTGYKVRARWNNGGSIITVQVPNDQPLAATADALIRAQGAQLDELAALGKT